MEEQLRYNQIPLSSLESGKPLNSFDILGFSLLYELNYTNVLTILDLAGIPFYSRERDLSWPLVIAGGPCMCNPEPVADFFDVIVIGDGEEVITKITDVYMKFKDGGGNNKDDLLRALAEIEGVYIPGFYKCEYDKNGHQILTPVNPEYCKVQRIIISDFNSAPVPYSPIMPFARPVHDRLRLEIARGCTRGCRFCQAGMIYRPVRERSVENLLSQVKETLANTGYEDVSLLSLSTGDYSRIAGLIERFMFFCGPNRTSVSLPSLRAGTLTPALINLIKKVRKTGFTIAPEAGTQRMRDVINKNISEQDIFKTVEDAFMAGWKLIKLYFMIGLPSETDNDILGIIKLVDELRRIKSPGKRPGNINVSITTLIPKPHTPFQWEPQISLKESKDKIFFLKDKIRQFKGVNFKWQKPEVSLIEGLFGRGDRKLSSLLVTAYKKGCRFDGWSDKFNFQSWQAALEEEGIDTDFYLARKRRFDQPLPWDHIDSRVSKDFLISECKKAVETDSTSGSTSDPISELTSDCRFEECNTCGVCDFENIQPVVNLAVNAVNIEDSDAETGAINTEISDVIVEPVFQPQIPMYKKIRIFFSKTGPARFFGHLEMVSIFIRAIRRADIPMKYSSGFHPMPKISFQDTLPVGIECENDSFDLSVSEDHNTDNMTDTLNKYLPEGLSIIGSPVSSSKAGSVKFVYYNIPCGDIEINDGVLKKFHEDKEFIITKTGKKGKVKEIDLKSVIEKIDITDHNVLKIQLRFDPVKIVRPAEILKNIFSLTADQIKSFIIVKRNEFFTQNS